MISGLPRSGQPGKAVGHAVGKQTLRHDLSSQCQRGRDPAKVSINSNQPAGAKRSLSPLGIVSWMVLPRRTGVDGLAEWSAWMPFSQARAAASRRPGVYLAQEGLEGSIVYAGMAGERSGQGIHGGPGRGGLAAGRRPAPPRARPHRPRRPAAHQPHQQPPWLLQLGHTGRALPQLVAAACQVGGLGGVARQLDGFVVGRARLLSAAQPAQ